MTRFPKWMIAFILVLHPTIAKSADSTKDVVFYRGDAVLGQLVDGGGWKTTITLVNLDTQAAAFQMLFTSDSGTGLTLSMVNESGATGTANPIQGTIPVGGSVTYSSAGTAQTLAQGWALFASAQRVSGQAVFRRALSGFPDIEAVVPFTSLYDVRQVLPFDNTGGFVMGVALTNPSLSAATVTLTFRSSNGTQLFQDTFTMQPITHTAFLLSQKYPQTANVRGVLEITTPGTSAGGLTGIGVGVLGLRGNPSGGLTTVLSEVSPDWVTSR